MTIEQLGDMIARSQDAELAAQVDMARARFDAPSPPRRFSPRVWVPLAAVAAVVAVVLGVRAYIAVEPLTFEIGERLGTPGEPIEAPAAADLPLRFSDRTTVLLEARSYGVVDELTARGARVRLHRGRAAVSVPPGHHAAWTFDVGPFEVAVTGTRFDVSWDDQAEVFLLVMHDGLVKVRGPTIQDQRVVVAGETLRVPLHPPLAVMSPSPPAPPDAGIASTMRAPTNETPMPARLRSMAPSVTVSTDAPPPPTWQELAAGGDFRAALAGALDQFGAICATGTASDITMLGDAARYSRDLSRAQEAYLAVRRRFPRSAATATFALARMAFQAPDDAQAIQWLDVYLRENPDGAFAREALGRLLEVYIRTHDDAGTRRIAGRYLAAYPSGPHAKLARSVLPP